VRVDALAQHGDLAGERRNHRQQLVGVRIREEERPAALGDAAARHAVRVIPLHEVIPQTFPIAAAIERGILARKGGGRSADSSAAGGSSDGDERLP
jgi:hypothetical protein